MLSIQRAEIKRVASREEEWTKRLPGASTRLRVHIFYSDTSGRTGAHHTTFRQTTECTEDAP
jgi:hypothetical protein